MIKKAVLFYIALFCSSALLANENNMDEVNEKIAAVIEARLHLIETSVDEAKLLSSVEFSNLLAVCKTNWETVAENFESIEGDDSKKVLIWGMGDLEAENYAGFLEALTTKYEAGNITEAFMEEALSPHGRMRAFIIDNYGHQRIQNVLNRIKARVQDGDFIQSLNEILSGEDKDSLDEYREGHEGLEQGNIPEVLLAE